MSDPKRFEPAAGISRARLERMVEEATVDCYGEAEEAACLLDALEEHARLPFSTTILTVAVSVVRFELTDRDDISRGRSGVSTRISSSGASSEC